MMQTDHDGASLAAVVAVFASFWRARAARRITKNSFTEDVLHDLVVKSLECPWLIQCVPTCDRKARRQSRLRAPRVAPDCVVYRSDGANRGQGRHGESIAGWGAAVWLATEEGDATGPPYATVYGHAGAGVSNNVAEYLGFLECLRRAVQRGDAMVIFQVDSYLVARQMSRYNSWACRSVDLVPIRDECLRLGQQLTENCIFWEVRHIYREYNQSADSLANQGVDSSQLHVQSDSW